MGLGLSTCVFGDGDDDDGGKRACCFDFVNGKEEALTSTGPPTNTSTKSDHLDDESSKKLFTAVYCGKKKTLETILRGLEHVDISSIIWSKGLNSLHIASMRGHLSCVKLLCNSCKFDIDVLDELDRTALTWAARNKHFAVYEYLRTKTLLSRLPDVYGILASQYLYDNNTEDNSSPTLSALEKSLHKLGSSDSDVDRHSLSQLSLHTISLCTSPASSRTSTPQKPTLRGSMTSEISPPMSTNNTTTTFHSTSPSSLDGMQSFTPPQSPLVEGNSSIYMRNSWSKQPTWLPNINTAVAVSVTNVEEVKTLYHNEISSRRQGSQLVPNLQDIITMESEESSTHGYPESTPAEDMISHQLPDASSRSITSNKQQQQQQQQQQSTTGGLKAFLKLYSSSSSSSSSLLGHRDGVVSSGLTEQLLPS